MKNFTLKTGLDIPISGKPEQKLHPAPSISRIGITGDDYIGLKPTMHCAVGDYVEAGQTLFTDKKNPGVSFSSPGCGKIVEINRGQKRKFESLVIEIEGAKCRSFLDITREPEGYSKKIILDALVASGLWTSLKTRPYGKIPLISSLPSSLFVTAADTTPLAPSPEIIIHHYAKEFETGLRILKKGFKVPIQLCTAGNTCPDLPEPEGVTRYHFTGPHPAGLPSTHIHMIDPASEDHMVWQLSYQDVIGIGHLFSTGFLLTEKIIALAGPGIKKPRIMKVPTGADLVQLSENMTIDGDIRILSGSVLDGRPVDKVHKYLGKFHNQVSALRETSGRALFNWLYPGNNRFSITAAFTSFFKKPAQFDIPTATWGGSRAIFPLGTYEQVMPLDIIATQLLKSIAVQDTEKAKALGGLELIEEDLALCSFVCPGKNNFGPMLRQLLTTIEQEG